MSSQSLSKATKRKNTGGGSLSSSPSDSSAKRKSEGAECCVCLEEISSPITLSSATAKDSKDPDGFQCACGNLCHFMSCSNVSFKTLGVAQIKVLLCLKGCVALLCPDCVDKTTTLATAVSAACDTKIAPLARQLFDVKSEITGLKDSFKALSNFFSPAGRPSVSSGAGNSLPSDSYAARTARGIHKAPPTSLSDAILQANQMSSAQLKEDEMRSRTILVEGLDLSNGIQSALDALCNELDIHVKPMVTDCMEWKQKTRSSEDAMQTDSAPTKAPTFKVILATEYQANSIIRSSHKLKNNQLFKKTFIKPLRSLEDRKLIYMRLKRAKVLSDSDPDNAKYKIVYHRQGFPLLRLVNDRPVWDWKDLEWDSWALLEANRDWAQQVEKESQQVDKESASLSTQ